MLDASFPNTKALATKAHSFNEKTKDQKKTLLFHCYVCHNISPEIASNKKNDRTGRAQEVFCCLEVQWKVADWTAFSFALTGVGSKR